MSQHGSFGVYGNQPTQSTSVSSPQSRQHGASQFMEQNPVTDPLAERLAAPGFDAESCKSPTSNTCTSHDCFVNVQQ